MLFDSFSITHQDRISIENLKNREFESLRLRIWREIAEKKRELEKTASLEPRVCEGLVYLVTVNKSVYLE